MAIAVFQLVVQLVSVLTSDLFIERTCNGSRLPPAAPDKWLAPENTTP
jgi:hypothetical protein